MLIVQYGDCDAACGVQKVEMCLNTGDVGVEVKVKGRLARCVEGPVLSLPNKIKELFEPWRRRSPGRFLKRGTGSKLNCFIATELFTIAS